MEKRHRKTMVTVQSGLVRRTAGHGFGKVGSKPGQHSPDESSSASLSFLLFSDRCTHACSTAMQVSGGTSAPTKLPEARLQLAEAGVRINVCIEIRTRRGGISYR
jgi:hypothetical protein